MLPEKLPRDVTLSLEKRILTHNQRNKIVRAIADRCFSADLPTKSIKSVADLAVNKWSPLKSNYGDKSVT